VEQSVTLVALKPSGSSEEEEMEAAALFYFKMFDMDGDGLIGENELGLAL
jgi:Ca2+-binding EF-hand superfamily protein